MPTRIQSTGKERENVQENVHVYFTGPEKWPEGLAMCVREREHVLSNQVSSLRF